MNASEQSNKLHTTMESMLVELNSLAKNPGTSSDELYDQSADVLRLLCQPDAVAIILDGVNGLEVEAVAISGSGELSGLALESATECNSEAFVFKDELDRTSVLFGLHARGKAKGKLLLRTKPNGFLAIQKKAVEDVGSILNQHLAIRESPCQSGAEFEKFNRFSTNCMSSLVRDELAEVLTNDVRLVLGAERTQYFESTGNRCRLKNVSSVSRFENRTVLLRASEALANEVFQARKAVLWDAQTDRAKLSTTLNEYEKLSGFPFVACFPMYGASSQERQIDESTRPDGVLVAEFAARPQISKFVETANIAVPQMSMALENAATFSSIPLHKMWLSLYRKFDLRRLRKAWLALLCLACFLLFVFSWKIDFKVRMQGTLNAVNERNVFSPRDAFVDKVFVDHGEFVKQGQVLLELRSPELQQVLDEAEGEIAKLNDLRAAKKVVFNQTSTGKKGDRYTNIRLAGEIAELDFKIQAQMDKRDFASQQMNKLKVEAPIDGTIVTWDVRKLLNEKPVRWGEMLLKIADENQQWQLRFLAPEKSMGYILDAAEENTHGIEGLNVEYFFGSRPDQSFEVAIANAGKSTEIGRSDELGVRIICGVSPEQELQRHGAQVTGDVQCGKRSIAFVWTHELVDAIRRHFVW